MAAKSTHKSATRSKKAKQENQFVQFNWEGRDYVLDLMRNRVYQNWMAIETNRGVEILGAYRQHQGI